MARQEITVVDHFKGEDKKEALESFRTLLKDAGQQAVTRSEMAFVSDMSARFERYGDRTLVSQKQFNWLNKIAGNEDDEDEPNERDYHGD